MQDHEVSVGELEGRTVPGIQQSLLLLQTNPSLPYKSDGVGEHLGFSQFKVKQRCAKMLSGPNHCVPGSRPRASLHMGHYSLFTDETGLSVRLGQSFLPFPCSSPCPARVSCNQKCFCHSQLLTGKSLTLGSTVPLRLSLQRAHSSSSSSPFLYNTSTSRLHVGNLSLGETEGKDWSRHQVMTGLSLGH